ncbi:PoNe immunity protein domain-containing protein [Capnocytophaga canimorsus]|uniref:PoNe immunity protein domain-containing protein n=1 Tax=Capnocytophaga canimorsus TaxID=28188 RepID=UPI0037D39F67
MQTNPYQDLSSMLINKTFTIEALKKYLSKQWYKDNKQMYWFDYHKYSKLYFGYWSFESGALVKILGLDEHPFKRPKILSVRYGALENLLSWVVKLLVKILFCNP